MATSLALVYGLECFLVVLGFCFIRLIFSAAPAYYTEALRNDL